MTAGKMFVVVLLMLFSLVFAYADEAPKGDMQQMEMGAPAQMKELAYLEGNWDVAMQWQNMEDTSKWDDSKATAVYKYILDGCVMQSKFHSTDMMGMPFDGYLLMSYDRDRKEWQALWTDTMGGKMSFLTGNRENGKLSVVGKDTYQGQDYLMRMVIFNEKPTSFDWTMDTSYDGGKTWQTVGKATYTKMK
jgi:hypothetical protein